MKSEYVRTMLYLINNSLYIGDESNIQSIKPVIPIDIDMTIDGVGGLKPFDLFRVDYLPEIYRNFTYFQVFNVGHTITPAGWETNITAKMKLDIDKYKQKYGKQFLKDKIDFESIATEFRTKEQVETVRERIDELLTSIDKNNRLIMRYESDIEIHTFEDTKESTAVEKLRAARGKAYLAEYNFNNFTYRLTDFENGCSRNWSARIKRTWCSKKL